MRPQKVSVNVWTMIFSSCSYLALAFVAWVFLRLVHACFWFPGHLRKQHSQLEDLTGSIQMEKQDVAVENKKTD